MGQFTKQIYMQGWNKYSWKEKDERSWESDVEQFPAHHSEVIVWILNRVGLDTKHTVSDHISSVACHEVLLNWKYAMIF
jgi:hypothetical protein